MSLASAFEKSKNLGDLTYGWLSHVSTVIKTRGIDNSIRLEIGNAPSLIAPAALVATIVRQAGFALGAAPVRTLLIGSDPLIRLDHSAWTGMAGDLLDAPGSVHVLLTFEEEALTTLNPLAEALGLRKCEVVDHADIQCGSGCIDLAIWIHPATESLEEAEADNARTALYLARAGIPVYATSFNDVDVFGQNFILNPEHVCLAPLGGEILRGSRALNKFAIATKQLGVEGGWSAVISKIEPATRIIPSADIDMVRTALQLFCAEGAIHSSWSLGQRVNGVAFNRIIPVGLLGNMAVDPQTGYVLAQDEDTRELQLIGHLWASKLATMPVVKEDLLLWASEIKLSFLTGLPKEDGKRADAIKILEEAYARGLCAAGIALARFYEGSQKDGSAALAAELYGQIGNSHPLSAYSLAYKALECGKDHLVEPFLRAAVEFGYPVACTDLGKHLYAQGRGQEALQELRLGAKAGDAEANYVLGELYTKANQLQESLPFFRKAWELGHLEAARLSLEVATHMLKNGLGKRAFIKREVKEISARMTKLERRAAALV